MTRVLVVDDEAPIRRALSAILRARGYEVDAVSTGEQALTFAALDAGRAGDRGEAALHHRSRRQRVQNTLRVHMAYLRVKLEPDRSRPRYLISYPGMGYRFVADGPV